MTITVTRFDASGGPPTSVKPDDISEVVDTKGCLLLVDIVDPTDEDLECMQEEFSLHHLAMEDVRKHQQRAKLEHYPTHAFVVAYASNLGEIDIFVGPSWLITVRDQGEDGALWNMDAAVRRFQRSGPEETTSGYLLYMILDELVDGYFNRTERVEDSLEAVEERIFAEALGDERAMQEELYALRRDLIAFRRRVQPMREVVSALLRKEVAWIDDLALLHLQDVYDHILRVTDQLDGQRELMGNAVDAHLAIISNRMNQVMKKMTSWGAILLGSTLVAGIYGMNFKHMPELQWRYGYPFALGIMVLITVGGYRLFRRRDWL
jgi:magnesium transporter